MIELASGLDRNFKRHNRQKWNLNTTHIDTEKSHIPILAALTSAPDVWVCFPSSPRTLCPYFRCNSCPR